MRSGSDSVWRFASSTVIVWLRLSFSFLLLLLFSVRVCLLWEDVEDGSLDSHLLLLSWSEATVAFDDGALV